MRGWLIRAGLLAVLLVPAIAAAFSPYLEFRDPIYIIAGFAGIAALALLTLQPVLMLGGARRWHIWGGVALVLAVVAHVCGLWLTSPPDVIDALLLRSPTPFSVWGVIAMAAVFAAALWAMFRRRLGPKRFRSGHGVLVALAVGATVPHAWQIEGTMEEASKFIALAVAVVVTAWALWKRRVFR